MSADGAERRRHADNRGDEVRLPRGNAAGQGAAQAVPNEMNLAAALLVGAFHRLREPAAKNVRAVSVPANAGHIRLVANPSQPGEHVAKILI